MLQHSTVAADVVGTLCPLTAEADEGIKPMLPGFKNLENSGDPPKGFPVVRSGSLEGDANSGLRNTAATWRIVTGIAACFA